MHSLLFQNINGCVSDTPSISLGFGAVANVYTVALNCTAGICGNRCAVAGDINLGAKGNHTRVNSNSAIACLCAGSCDACAACVIGGISSYLCADGFGVAHAVYDVLGANLNDFILCCCDYLFLNCVSTSSLPW